VRVRCGTYLAVFGAIPRNAASAFSTLLKSSGLIRPTPRPRTAGPPPGAGRARGKRQNCATPGRAAAAGGAALLQVRALLRGRLPGVGPLVAPLPRVRPHQVIFVNVIMGMVAGLSAEQVPELVGGHELVVLRPRVDEDPFVLHAVLGVRPGFGDGDGVALG